MSTPEEVIDEIYAALNQGGKCYQEQQTEDARVHYEQAMKLAREHLSPEDFLYCTTAANFAETLRVLGQFSEAESVFREAIQHSATALQEEPMDCWHLHNNFALMLNQLERIAEAESVYRASLRIFAPIQQQRPIEVAITQLNLARVLIHRAVFDEAQTHYEPGAQTLCMLLGKLHSTTLHHLHGLISDFQQRLGQLLQQCPITELLPAAEGIHQLAQNHLVQGDHLRIVDALNFAFLCEQTHQLERAETLSLTALEEAKLKLPESLSNVISALDRLMNLYYHQDNHVGAVQMSQEKVELTKQHIGEDQLDYAEAICELGGCYLSAGQWEQAKSCLLDALERFQKVFNNPQRTALALGQLSFLHFQQGDWQQAEKYCHEEMSMLQSVYDADHLEVARCWRELGRIQFEAGDATKAIEFYQRSLAIYEKNDALTHSLACDARLGLSATYAALGQFESAQRECQTVLDIFRQQMDEDAYPVQECQKLMETIQQRRLASESNENR